MLNKRVLASLTLGLTLALSLSGCGNRLPANVPVDASSEESAGPVATPTEEPAATPAPVATTPANQQPLTRSLVVSGIDKKKTGGFLGMAKKLEVKGSVINTSNVALSGKVTIKFTKKTGIINKKMEAVGDPKEVLVMNLAPGANFPFDVTSEKACDDAEVTVETTQPTATAAAASVSNPYGSTAVAARTSYGY
jgi:predicted small lipoprotein YifL